MPAHELSLVATGISRAFVRGSGRMKIAFIGTHGVGKTTLCYDLAAALKRRDLTVELVREVARECPLPINRDTTIKAQAWILHTQIAWELQAGAKAEVVVCDRAVLDNYCYLKRAAPGDPHVKVLEELVRAWLPTYDALFRVPIVGDPSFDGVRDTDLAFQHDIDALLLATLEEWSVPFVALDAACRDGWAKCAIESLLPTLRPQELLFPEAGGR